MWVYDVERKKKSFENGQGRSAYPFAVSENLYVPLVEGGRRHGSSAGMARWRETSRFAKQVHEHVDEKSICRATTSTAAMALFALEARSPYNIRKLEEALEVNPELLSHLATGTEASRHQLVLENLVDYADEKARHQFARRDDHSVLQDGRGRSSRTGHTSIHPAYLALLALTSRVYIALKDGGGCGPFGYEYRDVLPEFLNTLNRHVALASRAG